MIRRLSSIAITVSVVAFAHEASAQMQTAPMTQPSSGGFVADQGVDRAGGIVNGVVGFGARAGTGFSLGVEGGYTLPMHLYLGGAFDYFLGSSDITAWLVEAQVGYDLGVIKAAPVLIRPYLGLGYESFSFSCPSSLGNLCGSLSAGSVVISPGVLGAYFFTPHWFAGVDIRLDISAASGYGGATFDIYGTGGYKF